MCLKYQFKPETIKKRKAALPNGYITVYKIVYKRAGCFLALVCCHTFTKGLNVASGEKHGNMRYAPGFHSYATKKGALNSGWAGRVIKFQIRKSWITTMGPNYGLCYVTDRIICPSVNDKTAVVRS